MRVYRIFDTETQEYVRGASRNVFESIASAKLSCIAEHGTHWRTKAPFRTFSEQKRYEIHEFTLVRSE